MHEDHDEEDESGDDDDASDETDDYLMRSVDGYAQDEDTDGDLAEDRGESVADVAVEPILLIILISGEGEGEGEGLGLFTSIAVVRWWLVNSVRCFPVP